MTTLLLNNGSDKSVTDDGKALLCLIGHSHHDSIEIIWDFLQSVDSNNKFRFHNIDLDAIRSHLNKVKRNKGTMVSGHLVY